MSRPAHHRLALFGVLGVAFLALGAGIWPGVARPAPKGKTIAFTQSTYNVNEPGVGPPSALAPNVCRSSTGGSASVVATTTNAGTASSDDYTLGATETLTFKSGQACATAGPALLNDEGQSEPNVTVGVTLSNPSKGWTLGTQSSALFNVAEDTPPPEGPFGVSATPVGTGSITVSWNTNDVDGYVVSRSTSSSGPFTQIATVPGQSGVTMFSYTDTNLMSGTTYYYEVQDEADGALSNPFGSVSATAG